MGAEENLFRNKFEIPSISNEGDQIFSNRPWFAEAVKRWEY